MGVARTFPSIENVTVVSLSPGDKLVPNTWIEEPESLHIVIGSPKEPGPICAHR